MPRLTTAHVCIFGDQDGNITTNGFITQYLKNQKSENKVEPNTFIVYKEFNKKSYKVVLININNADEKNIVEINKCDCAFILFDMSNRESFDSILDPWIIFLRDQCKFNNKIYIVGDYPKNVSLKTNKSEILNIISISDINPPPEFINFGEINEDDKNTLVDKKICYGIESSSSRNEDFNITNSKGCIIM